MMEVHYRASPTMADFHLSPAFVRALIGPIGSGKSVACVMEMFLKSFAQRPNIAGIRKTRWAIIRNTYRELVDTTIKTFFDWYPEKRGVYLKKDMTFTVKERLPDNTTVQIEFLFRALDKPNDIKKLLSLELTGGWMNECREIPKQIMDMLIGRLGRYPNIRDGGASWYGLILDTNPPDSDHWFYKLFEVDLPSNHAIFHQPSGTSQQAENIANLPVGYYTNMQAGKDKEWINVYVHGRYGFVQDGKPVFPEYKDDVHYSPEPINLNPKATLYIGIDFGLTPAAVFGFKTASGRWCIFDELVATDMGADTFGRLLAQKLNHKYHMFKDVEIYGDPAGDHRAQTDEVTPFQILAKHGIMAVPTFTNDMVIRREATAAPMMRLDFSGHPAFLIGPGAPLIRKGLAGGYRYKRMAVSGAERFMDKPDKNQYSHVCDALQYLMVGAGEFANVIGGDSSEIDYSEADRMIV